jgi:ankyrin repeat protein
MRHGTETGPAIEDEDEVAETDKKTDLWSLTKAGDWNEIKKLYGSEEKQKVVLRVTEEELKARNPAGRCLLHLACNQAEPNREMIEYLIANNPADINCVDNNGCTPLHYACKKNNDAETVVILGTHEPHNPCVAITLT